MILLTLLTTLFAGAWIVAKVGLQYSAPYFFISLRMFLSACCLLAYYLFRHGLPKIKKDDRLLFGGVVLFGFFLTYLLDYSALPHLTTTQASFLFNSAPFFTAFYSYFHFAERMTPKKLLGMALAFAGFIPQTLTTASQSVAAVSIFSLPALIMIGAAASYSYGWVLVRTLVSQRSYSPLLINGIGMLFSSLMLFPIALTQEGWFPVSQPGPFFAAIAGIVLISNIALYNLYASLLKRYTATFLSLIVLCAPLVTALFDWLYFGHAVGSLFFISLTFVVIGLYLFYQEELEQG